jgi:hypothetical protein
MEAPLMNSGVEVGNISEDRSFPVNPARAVVLSIGATGDCPAEERDVLVKANTVMAEAGAICEDTLIDSGTAVTFSRVATGVIDAVREDPSCCVLAVNEDSNPTVDLGLVDCNVVSFRMFTEDETDAEAVWLCTPSQ